MKHLIENLIKPIVQPNAINDFILALPRIVAGSLLAFSFGASKFGMPWTPEKSNLELFEVSAWFVDDVAAFGGIFATVPLLLAWLAAASEAIGGLFLVLGLNTRLNSFLIACTMIVAIFFQQWDNGLWAMLPALGFLWVSLSSLILGSGRFGLDYALGKRLEADRLLKTPIGQIGIRKHKKIAEKALQVGIVMFCLGSYAQEKKVTFHLNTSKEGDFPKTVLIKGNIQPLGWENGLAMSDGDGDGIFTATVTFDTPKKYVQFKFEINGEMELQGADNRIVWFQEQPVQTSHSFNEFNFYDQQEISKLRYSASEIEEDLAVLKKTITYIHPNVYRFQDSITFQKEFQELEVQLKANPTLINSYGSISRFVSKVKCSHTFTNPWNQSEQVEKALLYQPDKLPFTFKRIGKRLFIDKNASENQQLEKGLEIEKINGIATEKLLTSLATYVSSDGNNYEKKLDRLSLTGEEKFSLFDIFFPIAYGSSTQFSLQLKNLHTGEVLSTSVASVSKTNRTRKLMAKYEYLGTEVKDMWSFDYINPNIAKLKMGTFAIFRNEIDWKGYLDNMFEELRQKNVKNLIVDIRGNEGGNGEIGRYLLSYALQRPMQMSAPEFSVRYLTIPENIKEHISTWEDAPYDFRGKVEKSANNRYLLKRKHYEARGYDFPLKKNRFKGKIYLITDSANSSATQVMASYAKNIDAITLVGQETGGNQMGINGYYIFFLRLPNTGIEIDVPVVGQYFPMGKNPKDGGIQPDIYVEKNPKHLIDGIDTEVLTILNKIN